MSRSREIRGYLVFSNRSEIWQAPRQQRFKHILFTIGEQSIYLATGRFGRFEVLRVSVAVPVGGPQPIPRVHQRETYMLILCRCGYWRSPTTQHWLHGRSMVPAVSRLDRATKTLLVISAAHNRRHLHYIWNTNMAASLHLGNKSHKDILCLTNLGRGSRCLGNNKNISYLSIDRQLNIRITAWPKLGIHVHANNAREYWE